MVDFDWEEDISAENNVETYVDIFLEYEVEKVMKEYAE